MTTQSGTQDMSAIADWFENSPVNKAERERLRHYVREKLQWIGIPSETNERRQGIAMLDYACGTGAISRIFAPYVSSITALDASPIMIEKYHNNLSQLDIDHTKVRFMAGDLLSDDPKPSLSTTQFDLITLGAALHAFPSAPDAIKRLSTYLRPGGILFIQDKYFDEIRHDRGPRGFSEDDLGTYMSDAGLIDFKFEIVPWEFQIELMDRSVVGIRCFIAAAQKP